MEAVDIMQDQNDQPLAAHRLAALAIAIAVGSIIVGLILLGISRTSAV